MGCDPLVLPCKGKWHKHVLSINPYKANIQKICRSQLSNTYVKYGKSINLQMLQEGWTKTYVSRTPPPKGMLWGKEGVNPFPHTTILQQTTLNIFCQKVENLYNWKDNLSLKVENNVAKGEIARFKQFLLLSLCFQKAVCCRGVRKHIYEGKG